MMATSSENLTIFGGFGGERCKADARVVVTWAREAENLRLDRLDLLLTFPLGGVPYIERDPVGEDEYPYVTYGLEAPASIISISSS